MRIGFVGGGTGGHFYPLMAVAEDIATHPDQPELYYFGPAPYNKDALAEHSIRYVYVPAGKVRRYFSLQNVLDVFRNVLGIFVALGKLYVVYPDVIFSKGGYTSVPVLLAAWVLRIPIVIHESDTKPGRANRLARRFARYIAISWPTSAEHFPAEKTALTGIPIRAALRQQAADPFAALGIQNDRPLVYVTGGSLGADRINNLILYSLQELLPYVRIVHQTGPDHLALVQQTARELLADAPELARYYSAFGTTDAPTVANLLSAASLVITRAGSTSLYEIALHETPAIIIPISEEVSHDQRTNAYAYARNGAASVMEEDNLTEHLLQSEILSILRDGERYSAMRTATRELRFPNAAHTIATQLITIGHEHNS